MYDRTSPLPLALTQGRPAARALLRGDEAHPDLLGEVLLYPWQGGSLVLTRLTGLPGDGLYPLHIHAAGACQTGGDVPFHCAGPFYPPGLAALAPVLSSGGTALSRYPPFHAGAGPGPLSGAPRPRGGGRAHRLRGHPAGVTALPAAARRHSASAANWILVALKPSSSG